MRFLRLLAFSVTTGLLAATAFAWDYEGHRAVNQLALASLPADFPKFILTPAARERIAFLSGEPDRWRNASDLPTMHFNSPDHYLDMEDLELVDATPQNLTEFRYVFAAQLAQARATHPERFYPFAADKNKDHTRELIGFLPWTITEYFGRLKSAFSYLRTFEEVGGSADEIANAQANVLYVMGVMGHYVGDGSQPLHTTKYHNGWVGENPNNYTVSRTFHAWIDGGFITKTGGISVDKLLPRVQPATIVTAPEGSTGRDPMFSAVINYLNEQHAKVVPLYELEKAGKLSAEGEHGPEGKSFIEDQILIAGHMLGSIWYTAWKQAAPDSYLRSQLLLRKAAQPHK
jgi:hypothetical protein